MRQIKRIYWISEPMKDRSEQLLAALYAYCGIDIIEIKEIGNEDLTNALYFVNSAFCALDNWTRLRQILGRRLRQTVLVSVDDLPQFSVIPRVPDLYDGPVLLEWTGCGCGQFYDGLHERSFEPLPNSIPGIGFVRNMGDDVLRLGEVPFDNRQAVCLFRGKKHSEVRMRMLRRLKRAVPCEIHYKQINYEEYLRELPQYQFCLCPTGFGHTWRFTESMAMGCVTITNNCDFLKFCGDYFKEGENYLSVGKRLERLNAVVDQLRDHDRMRRIAQAGRETFDRYFRLRHGVLPLETVLPVIRQLSAATGFAFDLKVY